MPPAPHPRGCPTEGGGPGYVPRGETHGAVSLSLSLGTCEAGGSQSTPAGTRPSLVPPCCPTGARWDTASASGVSCRAAGVLLIPPWHHSISPHHRDPPAVPGPRHRGMDKLPRPQAPAEPHSLLSPPCACLLPLPPAGSSSHEHAGTPTAAMGKPPDNVTQPEIAPAEPRTAHPATKL